MNCVLLYIQYVAARRYGYKIYYLCRRLNDELSVDERVGSRGAVCHAAGVRTADVSTSCLVAALRFDRPATIGCFS